MRWRSKANHITKTTMGAETIQHPSFSFQANPISSSPYI